MSTDELDPVVVSTELAALGVQARPDEVHAEVLTHNLRNQITESASGSWP